MATTRKMADRKPADREAATARKRAEAPLAPTPSKPAVKAPAAAPAAKPKTAKTAKTAKADKPAKPQKQAKAARPGKDDKARKPKLVRDSYTIPKAEHAVLDALKARAAQSGTPAKKSELLRAGIKALQAMPDAAFLAALADVPAIKTGRPAKA